MTKKTPSQLQDEKMAKEGFHQCDGDVPDSEVYRFSKGATAVGYQMAEGVAYEEDGITVKKGFTRIYYN